MFSGKIDVFKKLKYGFLAIFFVAFFCVFVDSVAAATNVYYSVGQTTANLMSSAPTMTVSGGVATFSDPQTGNIGVGDRISYNASSSKLYISGKITTSQWSVITATGTVPVDISTATTVNSIMREYTSLNSAIAGADDANHLATADLETYNFQLNIPCYYDNATDTNSVTVDGYTTGANNIIKIYTPNDTATEANFSQRHEGKWDYSKYRIGKTSMWGWECMLDIWDLYVEIEGIQINVMASDTGNKGICIGTGGTGLIKAHENIISATMTGSYSDAYGYYAWNASAQPASHVYNNIIYGFRWNTQDNGGMGFASLPASGSILIYNNTIAKNRRGIGNGVGNLIVAKNNIFYDCDEPTNYSTYISGTNYNATDKSSMNYWVSSEDNFQDRVSQIFSFADVSNNDYHLALTDFGARNWGTNSILTDSNLTFTDDIDGESRGETFWDIGADQYVATTSEYENATAFGGEVDITNGLDLYWSFDEGQGSAVLDRTGNGMNGVWAGTGTHWTTNGKVGGGGVFNGTDDGVETSGLSQPDQISASAWFYTGEGTNHYNTIVSRAGYNAGWRIQHLEPLGTVGLQVTCGSDTTPTLYTSASVNKSEWNFVVFTFDGAYVRFYLNGIEVYTATSSTCTNEGIKNTTDNFKAGKGQTDGEYWSRAPIDEVRQYSRAISQREVVMLYDKGKPGAEWHFRNNYNDSGSWCANSPNNHCKNLTAAGSGNQFTNGYLEKGSSALKLNGSGYASLADNSYFDVGTSSDFSISATIKTSSTNYVVIAAKRTDNSASSAGWLFGLDWGQGDGIPYLEVSDGTDEFAIYGNLNIADGKWHTISAVYDDSDAAGGKIYVDGIDRTGGISGTISGIDNLSNSVIFSVGDTGAGFGGIIAEIDRVAFYTYAMSRDDVLSDMHGNSAVSLGGLSSSQATGKLWDPYGGAYPLAWWKLDEMSGNTAADYASSSLDGTWYGAGTSTWHSLVGKKGPTGNFNVTNDYINVANTKVFVKTTAPFTVSTWVYLNSFDTSNYPTILTLRSDTTYAWNLIFSNQASFLGVAIGSGNTWSELKTDTAASALTGKWHHVAVSYNGSPAGAVYKIYLDGILQPTSAAGSFNNIGQKTLIGATQDSGNWWDGKIDEVKIFDYEFTPAQVAWDYNQGKPIIHYKLDQASSGSADGVSILDSSGFLFNATGDDGANNTGLSWTTGKFNYAIDFDGTDDCLNGGDIVAVDNSRSELTLSAWINLHTLPVGDVTRKLIIAKTDHQNNRREFELEIGDLDDSLWDRVYFNVEEIATAHDAATHVHSSQAIALNKWYHIEAVYKGGDYMRLYINGTLEAEKTSGVPTNFTDTTEPLTIGSRKACTELRFDGLIDDVRIYNYARIASQVKEDYNNGAQVRFGAQ